MSTYYFPGTKLEWSKKLWLCGWLRANECLRLYHYNHFFADTLLTLTQVSVLLTHLGKFWLCLNIPGPMQVLNIVGKHTRKYAEWSHLKLTTTNFKWVLVLSGNPTNFPNPITLPNSKHSSTTSPLSLNRSNTSSLFIVWADDPDSFCTDKIVAICREFPLHLSAYKKCIIISFVFFYSYNRCIVFLPLPLLNWI